MRAFTAASDERLSKLLLREYGGELSFARLNSLFRKKEIRVNGKRVKSDVRVSANDLIEVYFDGAAAKIACGVLFEDENILVVAKPKNAQSEKLYESLRSERGELYFCHRLDRNTDGVMIFAKNQTAYAEILAAFRSHGFDKFYRAEVYGTVKQDEMRLTNWLIKDAERGTVEIFDAPVKSAVKVELELEVLKRKENSTIVEIKLITGKTHQIRAQMAHIGHFVVGDGKYGDDRLNKTFENEGLRLTSYKTVLHFPKGTPLEYLDGKTIRLTE